MQTGTIIKNRGYIHSSIPVSQMMFGSLGKGEIRVSSRDWKPYLPMFESQLGNVFETMACVTFSALNCLEILFNYKHKEKQINYSDRFTAKMSGTTTRGNTLWAVAESIKRDGVVEEMIWPMGGKTFFEYYQDVPSSVKQLGQKSLSYIEVTNEFVPTDAEVMWSALGFGPLQVAIHAYEKPNNGIHPRSTNRPNHAVTICAAKKNEYWEIFDHYNKNNPFHKIAWDSLFWGALLFDINLKKNMIFKENYLYQLVEGIGGFYMYDGNKMLKLETFEHALAWIVRNNGELKTKVVPIVKADLERVEIYNFKNEKIA